MTISVYCGNCENGPTVLGCSEDAEKTRCTSCGVYMDDAILEEDFDEDYCYGCESGVDCAQGHSKKCQQEMENPEHISESMKARLKILLPMVFDERGELDREQLKLMEGWIYY